MDLSISIVSWNTRDILDQCLESVFATAHGIDFEVIVVDNASSDDSVQMIREKYTAVKLIENSENVGFSRANNQAYAVSSGRYFLLLNPDTVVVCDALVRLVEFADNNDSAGVVGPLVQNHDGTLQYSWARFPTLWAESLGRLDRHISGLSSYPTTIDEARKLPPFRTDWVGGCCMMVRRSAVEQVGPMDESLFMYCEETDWCLRLNNAGWGTWVLPSAEIVHLGGVSSSLVPLSTRTRLLKSKLAYFRKHLGFGHSVLLGLVLTSRGLARLIVDSLVRSRR